MKGQVDPIGEASNHNGKKGVNTTVCPVVFKEKEKM
jgi:hypothetical protein